jgi:4-hydroxyphenylpyruvate dioxygenase
LSIDNLEAKILGNKSPKTSEVAVSSIHPVENPLGILSIDHLEFTCDQLSSPSRALFHKLGFECHYQAPEQELFVQGQVRFLLNASQTGHSRQYFQKHGEGVSTMSFLVENTEHAYATALKRGATSVRPPEKKEDEHGVYVTAAIQGFGDVVNEFVERPSSFFRPGFTKLEKDPESQPLAARVARIDHLTNNVPKGEMRKWVDFYKQVYGFVVTRYFDIKGQKTGLESEVVQLPNGAVIIPINEPSQENSKSQIQEFLDRHQGAGVQHIALTCSDIVSTVMDLRERGIKFLTIPKTYYEAIPGRGFDVKEDLGALERAQLLVDGDSEGYLVQNFTETYIGPLFFEFIQRRKHNGFGEGNFQALFDAIEKDQMQRGYLS